MRISLSRTETGDWHSKLFCHISEYDCGTCPYEESPLFIERCSRQWPLVFNPGAVCV